MKFNLKFQIMAINFVLLYCLLSVDTKNNVLLLMQSNVFLLWKMMRFF